ncbi:MAG: glycosyltransferase [Pseudorhodobacter sp.]|nr:glycosyltransferase [Pseudorhodobacter sp.]
MPEGRLVAIVVTHDRPAPLRETLTRLLAQPIGGVVVVDNASGMETAQTLATFSDPRLSVVRLPQNKGGSGGFEAGMAFAMAHTGADWLVLMDDDARPAPGAIEGFLHRYAAQVTTAPLAIAAAVFSPDGPVAEMNRPSRNPFWYPRVLLQSLRHAICGSGRQGFHLPDADFQPDAPVQKIDVASFVGFFVNRSAVRLAGLPEGGLFLYGDDVLYSLCLRKLGVPILFDPGLRFEHACETLGPGLITRPLWKVYYLCRNGVSVAAQAAGPWLFPLALAWFVALWLRKTRAYPAADRPAYLRMVRAGLWDGLRQKRGRKESIHQTLARSGTELKGISA